MTAISTLIFSFLVALAGVPATSTAGSMAPRAAGYAQFTLTAADLAAMSNDADKACAARAARTPNDLSVQVDCNEATMQRMDTRIARAIRAVTPRLNAAKLRQLTANQRNWSATRYDACKATWDGELNPASNSYAVALSQCHAQETYRRALWVERLR